MVRAFRVALLGRGGLRRQVDIGRDGAAAELLNNGHAVRCDAALPQRPARLDIHLRRSGGVAAELRVLELPRTVSTRGTTGRVCTVRCSRRHAGVVQQCGALSNTAARNGVQTGEAGRGGCAVAALGAPAALPHAWRSTSWARRRAAALAAGRRQPAPAAAAPAGAPCCAQSARRAPSHTRFPLPRRRRPFASSPRAHRSRPCLHQARRARAYSSPSALAASHKSASRLHRLRKRSCGKQFKMSRPAPDLRSCPPSTRCCTSWASARSVQSCVSLTCLRSSLTGIASLAATPVQESGTLLD
jgi:hypothetical protein